jgi:hypothetical protein
MSGLIGGEATGFVSGNEVDEKRPLLRQSPLTRNVDRPGRAAIRGQLGQGHVVPLPRAREERRCARQSPRCADWGLGDLYWIDLGTGHLQRLGGGFGGTDGRARLGGRLFVSDWKNGRLFQVTSELEPSTLQSDKFLSAADISLTPDGTTLLVPDMKAGTLTWFPIR